MFELVPIDRDATIGVAVASFLARYREPTLTAYRVDLEIFLGWCASVEVEPLRATRGQLELYLRALEGCGYAPATVAHRFTTVATLSFDVVTRTSFGERSAVATGHA